MGFTLNACFVMFPEFLSQIEKRPILAFGEFAAATGEASIDMFRSAWFYGYGESERIIKKLLLIFRGH